MKKCGILIVSFGTTNKNAEEKSIKALEDYIQEQYQTCRILHAYTSNIIRKILYKRGEVIYSIEEALDQYVEDGFDEVFVLPTHLIYGDEYEKIQSVVKNYQMKFKEIKLGAPLLKDEQDMKTIAKVLHREYPMEKEECLVLMGHGTEHYCNTVYAAMEYICHEQGFRNIFVGTVEAYPGIDVVLKKVKENNYKKATLIPFMFVAGDHAINDMAGDDEDSWVNKMRLHGIETKVVLKGLGEYESIKELYCSHIEEMEKSNNTMEPILLN